MISTKEAIINKVEKKRSKQGTNDAYFLNVFTYGYIKGLEDAGAISKAVCVEVLKYYGMEY